MEDFQRFRWFFTSSGLLVIGGKSAESNEEVIKKAERSSIIMHTEMPGSPFCVMEGEPSEKDLNECAIFCASLSKAWKMKRKNVEVHVFRKEDVFKSKMMKTGTFGVKKSIGTMKANLKLYLTFQEGKIRGVPFKTDIASIVPGNMKKEEVAEEISKKLNIKKDEALSALPSDNISIEWF